MAELVKPEEAAKSAMGISGVIVVKKYGEGKTYFEQVTDAMKSRLNMRSSNLIWLDDWTGINVLAAIYSAGYINGARAQKEKWRAKYGEK